MESNKSPPEDQIHNYLPQIIIDEINDEMPNRKFQNAYMENYITQSTKIENTPNGINCTMSNPMSSHHLKYNQIGNNEYRNIQMHSNQNLRKRFASENQLRTYPMIPQLIPSLNTYNPYLPNVNINPHPVLPLSMNYLPQYSPNPQNLIMTNNQTININLNIQMPINQSMHQTINKPMIPNNNINTNTNNINTKPNNNNNNIINFIQPRTVKSQKIVIPQQQIENTQPFPSTDTINMPPGKRKSSSNLNKQLDIELLLNEMTITQIIDKTGKTFIKLIKTNKGSRYLQKIMKNISSIEIDLILNTIVESIVEIMCDYYGNYVLQEFLPLCNSLQRLLIYHKIKEGFSSIACDLCGTHSLQSLIMLISTKEEEMIIQNCIENNLLYFSNDPNSTHIIQKVIVSINEANRDYLNNFIISNLINLCVNPNGICVVKAFIQNTVSNSICKAIITIIELETNRLTEDQYGNFGIQEAIRQYGEKHCGKIIKKIIDHIVRFASQKFSSNVIDFLVKHMHHNNKAKFKSILDRLFLNKTNFAELIKNKYANFVLGNAIRLADINQCNEIKEYWEKSGAVIDSKERSRLLMLINHVF